MMAQKFDEIVDGLRDFDKDRLPIEVAYLDQLDAKINDACKLYGVVLDENATKAALITFALIDPAMRTGAELAIVTCLSRHI